MPALPRAIVPVPESVPPAKLIVEKLELLLLMVMAPSLTTLSAMLRSEPPCMPSVAPTPRFKPSMVTEVLSVGATSGEITELMTTSKSLIEAFPLFGNVLVGFQLVAVFQLVLAAPTQVDV